MGEVKVQRNYKDTVSRMLFRKPENALSLYNALNGTSYTDASQITFNMLDNAIYMGMQNDISFLIMNEVNLYEHQSTYNLNMPLRDLFYVAAQKLMKNCNLNEEQAKEKVALYWE